MPADIIIDGKIMTIKSPYLMHDDMKPYRKTTKRIKVCEPTSVICSHAFENFEVMESIELPETLVMIDTGAFFGCKSLKNVKIPVSVNRFGSNVFRTSDQIQVIFDVNKKWLPSTFGTNTGGIVKAIIDGVEYCFLTYCFPAGETMVVTGYVDHAGGRIYSGYRFLGEVKPVNKLDIFCYVRKSFVLYNETLEGLDKLLVKNEVKKRGRLNMERFGKNSIFIQQALDLLEIDLSKRSLVTTSCGKADPREGYEISEIRLVFSEPRRAVIEVMLYDRSIREKDTLRNKDAARFYIQKGKVYSNEEWECLCS